MELAANALVTLEMAKEALGIDLDDSSQDQVLIILINGISTWVENYLGYKLREDDRDETYQPCGRQKQLVRGRPITTVYEIQFAGETIPAQSYVWDEPGLGEYGILWRDAGWPYIDYIQGIAYEAVARSRNLHIRYRSGYVLPQDATEGNPSTLPADIIMAVLQALSSSFNSEFGDAAGLASYSISDVSWTFKDTSSVSVLANALRVFK